MTYLTVHHLINMFSLAYPALFILIVPIVYFFFRSNKAYRNATLSQMMVDFCNKKSVVKRQGNLIVALPTCFRLLWRAFQTAIGGYNANAYT